jgi:flagellar biosynthesis/type III secretory pathway protein FliH
MPLNLENEVNKLQEIFQGMPSSTFSDMKKLIERLQTNQKDLYNAGKIEGFEEGEKVGYEKGYQKGFIKGSTIKIENL